MNNEKIADALGGINDDYVREALDYKRGSLEGGITVSKKKLFTIAVAAAILTALLTMSLTVAATVAELMSDETAHSVIIVAKNYIVMNADPAEKNDLGVAVLEGLDYDGEVVNSEADFGFSGLRPVYNVSVKIGGYTYSLVIDAKTKEVLSCDRTIDEGWEAHVEEVREERLENRNYLSDIEVDSIKRAGVTCGEIGGSEAADIVKSYLENDDCELSRTGSHSTVPNYATDPESIFVRISHAGYVYEALVDSVTGEILHFEAFEVSDGYNLWYGYDASDDDYKPDTDVHLHEHTDEREFIGNVGAKRIAAAALSGDGRDWHVADFVRCEYQAGSHVRYNEIDIADLDFPDSLDYYYEGMAYDSDGMKLIFIDARTGDVLAICDSNP